MESLRSGIAVLSAKGAIGALISRFAKRLNSGGKSIVREVFLSKSATRSIV